MRPAIHPYMRGRSRRSHTCASKTIWRPHRSGAELHRRVLGMVDVAVSVSEDDMRETLPFVSLTGLNNWKAGIAREYELGRLITRSDNGPEGSQ